jgi:heme exporter protein D
MRGSTGKTDWPVLTTSIAKKWLDDGDGLQDRGITRDLDWGVPVKKGDADWPGMEGKVFYVWFDAPIEYIACAAEWVDAGQGRRCLGTLVAHRQGRGGRALRPVHGQGQRAVPHAQLPGHDPWEAASRGSSSITSSRSIT